MFITRALFALCVLACCVGPTNAQYDIVNPVPAVPFVWPTKPVSPIAGVPARFVYQTLKVHDRILDRSFPPIDVLDCSPALMQALIEAARIRSVVYKLDEAELLKELRGRRCVDKHFNLWKYKTRFNWEKEYCPKPPIELLWESGMWRLRVSNFLSHGACEGKVEEVNHFLDRVHANKTGFWTGDPYILDLLDNPGGDVEPMRILLNSAFSPEPYVHFYDVWNRHGGEWVGSDQKGLFGCPIATLVNYETASAAEIATEVLRRLCPRMVVVGQKTYGKFLGTAFLSLGVTLVQVSMDIYLLDGKKSPRYEGIVPDVAAPPGKEFEVALDYLKQRLAAQKQ